MNNSHKINFDELVRVETDSGIFWEGEVYEPLATFLDLEGLEMLDNDQDALEHYLQVVLDDNVIRWLYWESEVDDWCVCFTMPYDLMSFVAEYFGENYPFANEAEMEWTWDDDSGESVEQAPRW